MSSKIQIIGEFSNEEITGIGSQSGTHKKSKPKFMLGEHPGFEVVELPNGDLAKYAYNSYYSYHTEDLEIELEHIGKYEAKLRMSSREHANARKALKYHYKRCVEILSPIVAAGWNRWSENILELFIMNKLNKVVWGSGNCGKSFIFAILLYIKWRVRPDQRMVIIASKISKEAEARVWGYIKKLHLQAPPSSVYKFKLVDSKQDHGLYIQIYDQESGRWINDDTACMISLPIKTDAKNNEIGSNLLGRHPKDRLILTFDEGQELPSKLLGERIFMNWLTNPNLDVYAWGNPMPVDWHNKAEWDMLAKLGIGDASLATMRNREKKADVTSTWMYGDTAVLHLCMTDSPKDDPEEIHYTVEKPDGTRDSRLYFLAGKDNIQRIARNASPHSPAWYSQVLGFPFIDSQSTKNPGIITPVMIKEVNKYGLMWKTNAKQLEWFMGVDPSLGGHGNDCDIVVGRMGMMMDGRMGIDLMGGKYCRTVKSVHGEEFMDTTVKTMHAISRQCGIPLKNIAVETHGVGEVLRYALQSHIEDGLWSDEYGRGDSYYIVNPTVEVSDRSMFKVLGRMLPAKDMVADFSTELWIAARCAVMTRQIFNIPNSILNQFYNRWLLKNATGTKYKLEKKSDMKKRGVTSPDKADACCIMLELMRLRGFKYRFYNKGAYNPFFGQEYDMQQQQKKVSQRLGMVSRMLQLGDNMGFMVDTGEPVRRTKMERFSDIDMV